MLTIDSGTGELNFTLSAEISSALFGTSFENRGLSLDEGSAYDGALEKLSVKYLRFPGGSLTEAFFDIANPDATSQQSIFGSGGVSDFVPMSDFFEYAAANKISPTLVIPTFRYFGLCCANRLMGGVPLSPDRPILRAALAAFRGQ